MTETRTMEQIKADVLRYGRGDDPAALEVKAQYPVGTVIVGPAGEATIRAYQDRSINIGNGFGIAGIKIDDLTDWIKTGKVSIRQ